MENLTKRYEDGSKRPMTIDEQVQRLREIIYEYNGRDNVPAYDNVTVLIDSGVGGQAPAIAQELCKPWQDSAGHTHPGLWDEDSDDMKHWKEAYPTAIGGVMHLLEPNKYRTAMFEAARILVPGGNIKFPPTCPKSSVLVLDDGVERKLSKAEISSLIQMDIMKEEMVAIVRSRNNNGNVTYGLPPEKKRKMNDDRNYVAVMAILWIKRLREDEDVGEAPQIDIMKAYNRNTSRPKSQDTEEQNTFLAGFNKSRAGKKVLSPFSGKSPFVSN